MPRHVALDSGTYIALPISWGREGKVADNGNHDNKTQTKVEGRRGQLLIFSRYFLQMPSRAATMYAGLPTHAAQSHPEDLCLRYWVVSNLPF